MAMASRRSHLNVKGYPACNTTTTGNLHLTKTLALVTCENCKRSPAMADAEIAASQRSRRDRA